MTPTFIHKGQTVIGRILMNKISMNWIIQDKRNFQLVKNSLKLINISLSNFVPIAVLEIAVGHQTFSDQNC